MHQASHHLKSFLGNAGTFRSTERGEVNLDEIPAHVLERVCQYFYYKLEHSNSCVLGLLVTSQLLKSFTVDFKNVCCACIPIYFGHGWLVFTELVDSLMLDL
jgi:hypothetical protein